MKSVLSFILCHLFLSSFCQTVIGRPWTVECGASSNTLFKKSASLNVRYISPRFKWSNSELTEEEEKHPEKFKKSRLMFEFIYTPPLEVLCLGFNIQHRFLKYKRLSLEAYGGLKFFFVSGSNFGRIPYLKSGREAWYINPGLICHLYLGVIAPYADIGYDGIITIGAEVDFHTAYKKIKKRYRPPYLQST